MTLDLVLEVVAEVALRAIPVALLGLCVVVIAEGLDTR